MSTHPKIFMHNITVLFTVFECCVCSCSRLFSVNTVLFTTEKKVLVSITREVFVRESESGCAAVASLSRPL